MLKSLSSKQKSEKNLKMFSHCKNKKENYQSLTTKEQLKLKTEQSDGVDGSTSEMIKTNTIQNLTIKSSNRNIENELMKGKNLN